MRAQPYENKAGVKQFRPVLTEAEYRKSSWDGDNTGFCLACGADADGCEPDARQYKCDTCGAMKVYGLEELLMMGLLKIEEDSNGADEEPKKAV
jgi:hypothetical protein